VTEQPVPPSDVELARGLFDETWYPYEPGTADERFERFLALGPRADADPHPLFSVGHYLQQAPELVGGEVSPLLHFVRDGWKRGLSPHPLFDTAYYVRRYVAKMQRGEDPLTHFLRDGAAHRHQPHPWFDTAHYASVNADVAQSDINPLVHYVVFGVREGRRPHAEFDPVLHARRRGLPDGVDPLVHFLRRLAAARRHAEPASDPAMSIVVLNFNKPLMTVQAVVEALFDDDVRERGEIIVVDNGSDPENFATLRRELPKAARLLRLDENRFFGEGNNLGAELARAPLLVFLNNDAFVDAGALAELRRAFDEHEDCGAAGPRFLYPDGRVQEAGAMVSACGISVQRGKFLSPAVDLYRRTEPVDYVSAACVMVPTETFDAIGGFDLAWEPAYYEDADLGLKIGTLGRRVYYVPAATVVHVENTTSGDERLALRMDGIVEVNREKFIARWSRWLANGRAPDAAIALPSRARRERGRPLAVLYTPYPLYPGGGERYLLTLADALAPRFDVLLGTPEVYSGWRIRTLARDLRLDLSHVTPIAHRDLERYADCALFVAMGNELYPPVPAQGRRALYHCQFPFPMNGPDVAERGRNLRGYEAVIVNSSFTARYFRAEAERHDEPVPPIHIIAPPVPQIAAHAGRRRFANRIVNVGRFTPDGHSKRQDVLLEAFGALVARRPDLDLELHLAGAVPASPAAREYLVGVRRSAMRLPVTFHLNVGADEIDELYETSAVYWHATGYGRPADLQPELQEHFGIAIVEAMSAGSYPIVFDGGGPPEYIENGVTGSLWTTPDDLVDRTVAFLDGDEDGRAARSAAARAAAARFSEARFHQRIAQLVDAHDGASGTNGARQPAVASAPQSRAEKV